MPVTEIYSQRQKQHRGEVADVYQYTDIPEALRVQIVYIMKDAFEIIKNDTRANKVHEEVYRTFCREHGRRQRDASPKPYSKLAVKEDTYPKAVEEIIFTAETDHLLDVIELFFRHINQPNPYNEKSPVNITDIPVANELARKNHQQMIMYMVEKHRQYSSTVNELNQRFLEHGVGFQYESGQIIRVDSQYLHSEAVQPAFTILSDPMYEGANAEFRDAHENYRGEKYKDCLNNCLKAFESCLKAICEKRGWAYNSEDTASRLVGVAFKNKLIPDFMQSHFAALRNTLEAGVPTLRNKRGGHGQGVRVVPVPDYMAAYALHLTASNILFLAQANKNLHRNPSCQITFTKS